tara:strand:+ start:1059 stop:1331 length:273 start_codon:yes stop_codon:yes gene_type:complete
MTHLQLVVAVWLQLPYFRGATALLYPAIAALTPLGRPRGGPKSPPRRPNAVYSKRLTSSAGSKKAAPLPRRSPADRRASHGAVTDDDDLR